MKLIWNRKRNTTELFNLSRDPLERHDVTDMFPDRVESLKKAIRDRIRGTSGKHSEPEDMNVSEGLEERLRALGYIGE